MSEFETLKQKLAGNQEAIEIIVSTERAGGTAEVAALEMIRAGLFATDDAALRTCFWHSPRLQAEYGSEAAFVAYRKAAARGKVKVHRGAVVSGRQ